MAQVIHNQNQFIAKLRQLYHNLQQEQEKLMQLSTTYRGDHLKSILQKQLRHGQGLSTILKECLWIFRATTGSSQAIGMELADHTKSDANGRRLLDDRALMKCLQLINYRRASTIKALVQFAWEIDEEHVLYTLQKPLDEIEMLNHELAYLYKLRPFTEAKRIKAYGKGYALGSNPGTRADNVRL